MGEEFQVGVCGANWWNPSRNLFCSSPCSSGINDIGGFMGWPNHDLMLDMNKATTRSSCDSAGSVSDANSPQDLHQTSVNGTMSSIDSTLQMMGINLSSSTTTHDWNQDFLHDNARSDGNYSQILQEPASAEHSSMNYLQEIPKINLCEDSSFKQSFHDQPPFNSITTTTTTSPNIPLNTASYGFPSPLLQTLFDSDSPPPQQQQQTVVDYSNCLMMKPPLQFSNMTPFWNATAAPLTDVRASFLPSTIQSHFVNPSSINNPKPNRPNFVPKHNYNEKAGVEKKGTSEPPLKRPRIGTPSPLPTFKVRREKLGDRITALQQLVSPFGKIDTASVLHEAIEYIKFLHDQVGVLSTPYMKNGSPPLQRQHATEKIKEHEGLMKQDLKSRGLCLVPISSTFPVASETTTDFWTPTFGGSFR